MHLNFHSMTYIGVFLLYLVHVHPMDVIFKKNSPRIVLNLDGQSSSRTRKVGYEMTEKDCTDLQNGEIYHL